MSLYLRELQQLLRDEKTTISSTKLGRLLGVTDAQVRKDFAYFGQFGYPGIGYRCEELVEEIRRILGTDRLWPAAMVGCGNLGQALLGYRGFQKQGFAVAAAFDVHPSVIGREIHGLTVYHVEQLPEIVQKLRIQLAILAVPAEAVPHATEILIKSRISGVLNFAPVTLNLPKSISVVGVDLAMELEQLTFAVVRKAEK
jgi:redox-sensing transcriptional repressor